MIESSSTRFLPGARPRATRLAFLGLAGCLLAVCARSYASDTTHSLDWATQEIGGGRIQVSVHNTSPVAITAVLVEGKRLLIDAKHPLRSVRSFDSALEPYRNRSLESGKTYDFILFGPKPDPLRLRERSAAVKAALFADGGTWGEQRWIDTLLSVRKTAYKSESQALQIMIDAKTDAPAGGAVLQKLEEAQKADKEEAESVYDRIVIGQIFKEVIGNVVTGNLEQAPVFHSLGPFTLKPATPKVDNAIRAVTVRMRSLESAGLPSSR